MLQDLHKFQESKVLDTGTKQQESYPLFIYLFLTLLGCRNISRSLISSIAERKQ